MEQTEHVLALLKQGDKRGLELLFRQFYKPLVMYATRYVPLQEDAEITTCSEGEGALKKVVISLKKD